MSRNLFEELTSGFEALKLEREGKLTLTTHTPKDNPVEVNITSDEIVRLREDLKLSQAIFAHYLRINKRTLENWEQGRSQPNAQAAVLLRLVQKYPDTIDRLQSF